MQVLEAENSPVHRNVANVQPSNIAKSLGNVNKIFEKKESKRFLLNWQKFIY
jgi:hypothetical protein